MEWNEELIAQLQQLWAEGRSTAEIGRRLSISKNAVVGKAHRLFLAPRPSPIRRGSMGETAAQAIVSTLPPLPARRAAEPPRRPAPPAQAAIPPAGVAPAIAAPPKMETAKTETAMRPVMARVPRLVVCCWPIGEPGTPSFRFCDAGALQGKPYCAAHAQIAYVKVRERREEAA